MKVWHHGIDFGIITFSHILIRATKYINETRFKISETNLGSSNCSRKFRWEAADVSHPHRWILPCSWPLRRCNWGRNKPSLADASIDAFFYPALPCIAFLGTLYPVQMVTLDSVGYGPSSTDCKLKTLQFFANLMSWVYVSSNLGRKSLAIINTWQQSIIF